MAGDRERLLAIGMSGYVSKPIEERTLVTAITRILALPFESDLRASA